MVVTRECSFCANEIEPGTGSMFVKRDGTVFNFCSGSCRKQQLGLGRVGHRLKWTRAHSLKVAIEQRTSTARAKPTAQTAAPATPKPSAEPAPVAPAPKATEKPVRPAKGKPKEPATEKTKSKPATSAGKDEPATVEKPAAPARPKKAKPTKGESGEA